MRRECRPRRDADRFSRRVMALVPGVFLSVVFAVSAVEPDRGGTSFQKPGNAEVSRTAEGRLGTGEWPTVIELDRGQSESVRFQTDAGEKTWAVELVSVEIRERHALHFAEVADGLDVAECRVTVRINGAETSLVHRAYEMPATISGLRILVEAWKPWAEAGIVALTNVNREVRISMVPEGRTWGPAGYRFPVRDYR